MKFTLPTDSAERKKYPIWTGFFRYFPAAIMGAANLSKEGNDKHNPGEDMHHARDKSNDHEDCIQRHLMDYSDLRAAIERLSPEMPMEAYEDLVRALLTECDSLLWRAAALSQEVREIYAGAPKAPAARGVSRYE